MAHPFHEPAVGGAAFQGRAPAARPGFMAPMRVRSLEVEAPHEPRSSRREEAHSSSGKGSQSLLTSAATVQGFNAPRFPWENSCKGGTVDEGPSVPKRRLNEFAGSSRPFGTYAKTNSNPAVNCRAILNSPFGRCEASAQKFQNPELSQKIIHGGSDTNWWGERPREPAREGARPTQPDNCTTTARKPNFAVPHSIGTPRPCETGHCHGNVAG